MIPLPVEPHRWVMCVRINITSTTEDPRIRVHLSPKEPIDGNAVYHETFDTEQESVRRCLEMLQAPDIYFTYSSERELLMWLSEAWDSYQSDRRLFMKKYDGVLTGTEDKRFVIFNHVAAVWHYLEIRKP